jgi:hypothetical protein
MVVETAPSMISINPLGIDILVPETLHVSSIGIRIRITNERFPKVLNEVNIQLNTEYYDVFLPNLHYVGHRRKTRGLTYRIWKARIGPEASVGPGY